MIDTDEADIREKVRAAGEECYATLFEAYRQLYVAKRDGGALPDTIVGGALVGALLHVAAAAAVGMGLDDAAFHLAADEAYEAALRRAPRWG